MKSLKLAIEVLLALWISIGIFTTVFVMAVNPNISLPSYMGLVIWCAWVAITLVLKGIDGALSDHS